MSTQEAGYNLTVLGDEMKQQFYQKMAASTMEKCHASCLISLSEN